MDVARLIGSSTVAAHLETHATMKVQGDRKQDNAEDTREEFPRITTQCKLLELGKKSWKRRISSTLSA